jgi:hypothetical protein
MGKFRYTATATDKATGATRTESGTVSHPSPAYEQARARTDVTNHVRKSPTEQVDVDLHYGG